MSASLPTGHTRKRTVDSDGPTATTTTALSKKRRRDDADAHGHGAPKRARRQEGLASDKTAGVQKLKSALRQCRRLLAKDNVAADKRVQAERQLASLTDELARAEAARKERDMSQKYHMVKFFERQKVLRKIVQAKKAGDDQELWERRVDLAYILNYSKTTKYVSLLKTPSASAAGDTGAEADTKGAERVARIRADVAARMRSGELSAEPERGLGSGSRAERDAAAGGGGGAKVKVPKVVAGGEGAGTAPPRPSAKGDAFFEESDESGSDEDSSEDE